MSTFTGGGDDGFSGLLGEGRVSKSDARLEALGSLDEATAALGVARAQCEVSEVVDIILQCQRDLYHVMAEVAALPQNAKAFRAINGESITWLEAKIEASVQAAPLPTGFIIPGDCQPAAALDLARTIVRRAERRVVALIEAGDVENRELIRYLNRLSSLIFVLELREIHSAGLDKPTLAKAS